MNNESVTFIEGVIKDNKHDLASKLLALYDKWRVQRIPRDEEIKELRNYLFATDTTTTSNSGLPWKNKTTLPKLTQIRDNLHTNYFDALFPNDDWMIWEGDDTESVESQKRQSIETYIKNKANLSGFREVMSDCLLDYIDTGEAYAEVIYVRETHVDEDTAEEIITYQGPKVLRISRWDHYFNLSASSYSKSPKFTRYLKNIGELRKEVSIRKDLNFDKTEFDKMLQFRSTMSGFNLEDLNKADGYIADGFGTYSEYLGSGLVELIEYEGDLYDATNDVLHEKRLITIADGTFILRNIRNPNWIKSDNKVHVRWRERPDNLAGMGPLDNLVGMQYRLDHLENLKADAFDLVVRPPLKIKGEVEPFVWAPGAQIRIPEDGDVNEMPPNALVLQADTEIAFIMNLMEELAGAPKQAMGFRTPGEKTAFEVQSLETAAGRIFNNKIMKFSIQFMEPLLNLMLETSVRNFSSVDTIKVLDSDIGVIDFMSITKEDIRAKGKLRPVGARHFSARAQLIQNLTSLFQTSLGELIKPDLSRVRLTAMLEEVFGLEKFKLFRTNVAVEEQAETQRIINQATQNIQEEQVVDLQQQQ